jgi:hypothetical protein
VDDGDRLSGSERIFWMLLGSLMLAMVQLAVAVYWFLYRRSAEDKVMRDCSLDLTREYERFLDDLNSRRASVRPKHARVMPYGKHKNKPWLQVYNDDPGYCKWTKEHISPQYSDLAPWYDYVVDMDDLEERGRVTRAAFERDVRWRATLPPGEEDLLQDTYKVPNKTYR